MEYNANTEVKPAVTEPVTNTTETKPATSSDWKSQIPDEYKSFITDDITDVGTLAKQFAERGKFLGNSIRIPGEDASPESRVEFMEKIKRHAPNLITRPDTTDAEAMATFWEMAGVPRDHNNYKIVDAPADMDTKYIESLKPLAKKYGITNAGFDAYVKDQYALTKKTAEERNKFQEKSLSDLRGEWGSATDGKIADIKKFADQMGFPKSFTDAISSNMVSGEWLKTVDNIIKQFGGIKEGSEASFQRGANLPDTPGEIEQKIAEIEGNPSFKNRMDPRHKTLVAKRMSLITDLSNARNK